MFERAASTIFLVQNHKDVRSPGVSLDSGDNSPVQVGEEEARAGSRLTKTPYRRVLDGFGMLDNRQEEGLLDLGVVRRAGMAEPVDRTVRATRPRGLTSPDQVRTHTPQGTTDPRPLTRPPDTLQNRQQQDKHARKLIVEA